MRIVNCNFHFFLFLQVLYVEEERILGEFVNVKASIASSCMVDEDEFEAARETCLVLGGKLMEVRGQQERCYQDNEDLEAAVDRDIVRLR